MTDGELTFTGDVSTLRTVHAVPDADLLRDAEGRVVCEFCYAVMEESPVLDEELQEIVGATWWECPKCGAVEASLW